MRIRWRRFKRTPHFQKGREEALISFAAAEEAAKQEYADWRSGNIPSGTKVTHQEYWEMKYRQNRYLSHLSDQELAQRLDAVMNNMVGLTPDEKIKFLSHNETQKDWQAEFTVLLEESRLRHTGLPTHLLHELHHPDYDWPGIPKAAAEFHTLNVKGGEYLVKYLQLNHGKEAFEKGRIQVNPASTFKDPSLNYALEDDELQLSLRPPSKTDPTVLVSATNYYVYCMTNEFDLRLFGDFKYNACLIITEPAVFVERLAHKALRQLPRWRAEAYPVIYVDPVRPNSMELDIFRTKDFRYSYQKEYRIVWLPPFPLFTLKPIIVELGDLSDSCHLISL